MTELVGYVYYTLYIMPEMEAVPPLLWKTFNSIPVCKASKIVLTVPGTKILVWDGETMLGEPFDPKSFEINLQANFFM